MSWLDRNGNPCTGHAECVDLSEGGMRVRLRCPLDVRTFVSLKFQTGNLHGSACVRSCTRERMTFVVGLQFTGGMRGPLETTAAAHTV
jgi:hypothetical protein